MSRGFRLSTVLRLSRNRIFSPKVGPRSNDCHPFFDGFERANYIWCFHCEHVWPKSDWVSNSWHCPDSVCDGSPFDSWKWEEHFIFSGNYPSYPRHPEPGSFWPLYPDSTFPFRG